MTFGYCLMAVAMRLCELTASLGLLWWNRSVDPWIVFYSIASQSQLLAMLSVVPNFIRKAQQRSRVDVKLRFERKPYISRRSSEQKYHVVISRRFKEKVWLVCTKGRHTQKRTLSSIIRHLFLLSNGWNGNGIPLWQLSVFFWKKNWSADFKNGFA